MSACPAVFFGANVVLPCISSYVSLPGDLDIEDWTTVFLGTQETSASSFLASRVCGACWGQRDAWLLLVITSTSLGQHQYL